jgi:hypothetical protein
MFELSSHISTASCLVLCAGVMARLCSQLGVAYSQLQQCMYVWLQGMQQLHVTSTLLLLGQQSNIPQQFAAQCSVPACSTLQHEVADKVADTNAWRMHAESSAGCMVQ